MTGKGGGETGGELQEEEKRAEVKWNSGRRTFRRLKLFVLSEAAQFVIWQLRLHFICKWGWRTAPSVNLPEEETNSKRSGVNSWQLTGSDTGSSITGVWHWCWWTAEQEVTSAEDSELETKSHVMLRVPTWPRGDGPGLQPQPAWGVSARLHEFVSRPETARRGGEKLFVQRGMSVNQLNELSVEVWVLCSLQLLGLCEPACNSDGTWQVEFPLVVHVKEQKNWTCTTKTCAATNYHFHS